MRDDNFNVFHLCNVKKFSDEKVHKVIKLGKPNGYVYEVETESHGFIRGFPLIKHNTDSFVLSMNTNDTIEDSHNFWDLFDWSNLNKKRKSWKI